jgi:hypothetical protein
LPRCGTFRIAVCHRFPDAQSINRPLTGAFVVKFVHRVAP